MSFTAFISGQTFDDTYEELKLRSDRTILTDDHSFDDTYEELKLNIADHF